MKYAAFLQNVVLALNTAAILRAQESYPDFALVVQLPSYETFITNLGDSPIRVDGYQITSVSGSLSPEGWKPLASAGPEVVAALGRGAAQFFAANPSNSSLSELNPISSATWQPGQSWSIGFPFNADDPNSVHGSVFRFSSPDGLVLTGGTVAPPSTLVSAALLIAPEPSSSMLCALAAIGMIAFQFRRSRPRLDSGGGSSH